MREWVRLSTVAGKRVILDSTATTTCRGRMQLRAIVSKSQSWASRGGAGVRAVSPAERLADAKRAPCDAIARWTSLVTGDHVSGQ